MWGGSERSRGEQNMFLLFYLISYLGRKPVKGEAWWCEETSRSWNRKARHNNNNNNNPGNSVLEGQGHNWHSPQINGGRNKDGEALMKMAMKWCVRGLGKPCPRQDTRDGSPGHCVQGSGFAPLLMDEIALGVILA